MSIPGIDIRRGRDERGITMLEMTMILAAVTVIAAAVTPSLLRMLQQSRTDNVMDEMAALHAAIVGAPGSDTYGFVGDIGRPPANLVELIDADTLPRFEVGEATGIGYGWNGPYVTSGRDADDYALDPWGNIYDISLTDGRVVSAGPSGLFNDGDDLAYPPAPSSVYGTLIVSIKGHRGELVETDPAGCLVALAFAADGVADVVVDQDAPFSFNDVHRGLHTVEVACVRADGEEAYEAAIVAVHGAGAQQVTELHVELGEAIEVEGSPVGDDEDSDPAGTTGPGTTGSYSR